MSTPKDKAKELVDKFSVVGLQQRNEGIACALIAVDYIIDALPISQYDDDKLDWVESEVLIFWEQVKEEIEKL